MQIKITSNNAGIDHHVLVSVNEFNLISMNIFIYITNSFINIEFNRNLHYCVMNHPTIVKINIFNEIAEHNKKINKNRIFKFFHRIVIMALYLWRFFIQ